MVAQDDGALGDRVKVLSNDKKKSFVAAVTGRGSVRVQL
jgi:flagella basal body P-ring formation protein FlgA